MNVTYYPGSMLTQSWEIITTGRSRKTTPGAAALIVTWITMVKNRRIAGRNSEKGSTEDEQLKLFQT